MKQNEDTVRIHHMLESSEEACGFMSNTPFEDFKKNRLLANGIVRSLEVVGEAASQVTKEFKEKHPEIEWPVIVSMRNRLIHAYFDINYPVIWQTVREDLPLLIEKLKKLLKGSST